ncbi:MAG: xanthine dehydrogenase family protein subunit M [Nitrososphaerota archaeon]|nr:xanthine dehydrogenase family protein subunit M [Nitrososphaerota archaeon]
MNPRQFEFYAPETIDEALSLLTKFEGSKLLAGGHSLIPLMKLRIASPEVVVDINGIKELSHIKEEGREIRIGPLTRLSEVQFSPLLMKACPMLPETAGLIADPQVRNRGTVGGNLAHGDPANDLPPAMIALGASFVIRGPKGSHVIKAEDFFLDLFTTRLEHDELLTEVVIPVHPPNTGMAYVKFERKVGDFSTVSVASRLTLGKDGKCTAAGIGLGGVAPTALKAVGAEKTLVGEKPTEELVRRAAGKCAEISKPTSDLRGSAEYKREMTKVFAARSLNLALERSRK